jgi:AcrR family transcriptional regulator
MTTTKRDAICDAALDLFVEKGISASTTREIAVRAETAEGNLYRHFAGKDALARHLFGVCAGRFRRALIEAAEQEKEPRARLAALVRAIFLFAQEDPKAFAYILQVHHHEFATGPIRNPQPLPKDVFAETLQAGIKSGVFRPTDAALATSWIVGMAQRTITFLETGRVERPREEVIQETIDAAFRLVR